MGKLGCLLVTLCLCLTGQVLGAAEVRPQVTFIDKVVNTASGPEWKLTLHYPQVTIDNNREAAQRINKYYEKWVAKTMHSYQKGDPDPVVENKESKYTVSYNDGKYLSFLDNGYVFYQGAAHPLSWLAGDTFVVATGKKVSWQEIIRETDKDFFTLAAINAKILATPEAKAGHLFPDFHGLKKLPENYYLSKDGNIHFNFGQYEIAPYAVGFIDIDMGKKPK